MTTLTAPRALRRVAIRAVLQRISARVPQLFPARMPSISPKIARDIGLSPADLERLQPHFPSDHAVHPRL